MRHDRPLHVLAQRPGDAMPAPGPRQGDRAAARTGTPQPQLGMPPPHTTLRAPSSHPLHCHR
ncbi:hypothetical protein F750_3057 [Streptomyces sp. PAMC 26508]|nr:hypothetical protein F750_3057 [Streptomyces sp. PAMC 26508]